MIKKGTSVAIASYDKVELMLLFFAKHVSKFKKIKKKKDLKRLSLVFECDLEAVVLIRAFSINFLERH